MKEKRGIVLLILLGIFLINFVSAENLLLNSTYNLGDAYVNGAGGNVNTNYGANNLLQTSDIARTYLNFNLSSIPLNQNIDNASLCLYVLNTKKVQLINVSQVYSSFNESNITWNNQPCGINFDNSTMCNLTKESSIQMTSSISYSWLCWNVTQAISKSYSLNNGKVSMVLYTSDAGPNSFNSKEATDSSLTPYLNITYHTSDIIPPNLSIISPIDNLNSSDSGLDINYTASDSNLQSCWWTNNLGVSNNSLTCGQNITSEIWNQGSNSITIYANDSVGNINSSSVTFFVDSVSPAINIIKPEPKTYGINTSIPLNFSVSDSGIGVQGCWYNLDNGLNKTLDNCQNATFNASSDKTYTLNLFANDSLGNENSKNVSFNVVTTAPAINLISPTNNSYLIYNENIYFNYTVDSGIEISTCQLFGNFDGIWKLNQTNISTQTGINNYFLISNLNDSTYNWGILCTDIQNRSSMKNYTFTIDTINPMLTLTEPTGTKSSQTNIPIIWNVSDSNLNTCWYNRTLSTGDLIGNIFNSVNCLSNSATTFVSTDGNFILNFYANDSAGNLNFSSLSFSVSTASSGGTPSGSGGGGGGSTTTIVRESNNTIDLTLNKISGLIGESGQNKIIKLKVKNTGAGFLNECKLNGYGDYPLWISSKGAKNLAAGEEFEFEFDVNIPKNVSGGNYILEVLLKCKEIEKNSSFNIEIINKQLDFKLIEVKRVDYDRIKLIYSIEELSGIDQNVSIQFLLFGKNKEKITEIQERVYISANSIKEFESFILIDSSLSGNLDLLVNLNSETYSTFVEENVILGKFRLGGFAIFGDIKNIDNLILVLLILSFSIFSFFIIRKIFSHKKSIRIKNIIKKIELSYKNKNY